MKIINLIFIFILFFGLFIPVSAMEVDSITIAPKFGMVMMKDWKNGFIIGTESKIGEIAENIYFLPFVNVLFSGRNEVGVDLSYHNIQFGADVHYFIKEIKGLYIGGGLCLNLINYEYQKPSLNFQVSHNTTVRYTTESNSKTEAGFGVLAGYMLPFNYIDAFIESKYNIIVEPNTLEISIGIIFDM